MFNISGMETIGETKAHQFVSTCQIAAVAEDMEIGNSEVADRILIESRKLAINAFQNRTDSMKSHEFLKYIKMSTFRKTKPGAHLGMHKLMNIY